MTYHYVAKIAYRGDQYFGWQTQKNECLTVQSVLEEALGKLCSHRPIQTIASGRTDRGVHALGQVVKLEIPVDFSGQELCSKLNQILPPSIQMIEIKRCLEEFHPLACIKRKTYLYGFYDLETSRSPFLEGLASYCPYHLDQELLQEGLKLFEGEHDFVFFHTKGSEPKSTTRLIYRTEYFKAPYFHHLSMGPQLHWIRLEGNGFLKQMVRMIVGSLWLLGRGKITLKDLKNAIDAQAPLAYPTVAPPEGLYLESVNLQDAERFFL